MQDWIRSLSLALHQGVQEHTVLHQRRLMLRGNTKTLLLNRVVRGGGSEARHSCLILFLAFVEDRWELELRRVVLSESQASNTVCKSKQLLNGELRLDLSLSLLLKFGG